MLDKQYSHAVHGHPMGVWVACWLTHRPFVHAACPAAADAGALLVLEMVSAGAAPAVEPQGERSWLVSCQHLQ